MENKMLKNMGKAAGGKNILENIALVLLAFYPLRHISWGLDLWDTGYNYANFQYMGTEHMDPMWLFSTYLANAAGNLLTRLPNGGTLLGMNLYTALFASALGLLGYFFCTRALRIPKPAAFAGEFIALSLCWCPTALLYNYLTYILFLGCVILLYYGLTKEKKGCLIAAGACLGTNVLVRFSNLPEMAMIVAVWAYDVILWLEGRKEGKGWRRLLSHTGWCLLGYAAALAVLLGWIQLRYGLDEYGAGIARLFAMTDNAADYKPTAMIMGLIGSYVENLYWAVRIFVIVAGGLLAFMAAGLVEGLLGGAGKKPEGSNPHALPRTVSAAARVLHAGVRVLWVAVCAVMLWWLYHRKFCSFLFQSYDSMLRPGILFLMLAMFIAAVRIFHRNTPREERLISGMLILVILLTSLGSNNGVYPSLNNLFVAAPYTLWESWRFIKCVKDKKLKHNLIISPFPVKGVLIAFLAMCFFQFGFFGAFFSFAEATGVQDVSARVENNDILKNIGMSPQKAQWMTEIGSYVEENGLRGKEVILYGNIPALSYYLQMPSAFNPWSSLDSYSRGAMEQALAEVSSGMSAEALSEMSEGMAGEALPGDASAAAAGGRSGKEAAGVAGKEAPVIIIDWEYTLYMRGGTGALEAAGIGERRRNEIAKDEKLPLLIDFMERWGYRQDFDNGKFTVYRRLKAE